MPHRPFIGPKTNPLVVRLVRLLMPLSLNSAYRVTVQIDEEDLQRLRSYKGQRMLLLANHPTGDEATILFEISKRLDEIFNFVAARELFDRGWGFRGWLLRRVGGFLTRGCADRKSFMTSRNILMEGRNRLFVFIEGQISRRCDTLIPFELGVIQLACRGAGSTGQGSLLGFLSADLPGAGGDQIFLRARR